MPSDEEVRALARQLHAHYDVSPDLELRDGARVQVGIVLRLWAVHPKGERALPGCLKCRDLAEELKRIAATIVPGDVPPEHLEIEPFRPALYDSRVVPGADEVALSIRLARRDAEGGPRPRLDERWLKDMRANLRRIGVPER